MTLPLHPQHEPVWKRLGKPWNGTAEDVTELREIMERVKAARIPPLYAGASLSEARPDARHQSAADKIRDMLRSPETIVLCGRDSYRLGKTRLACATVWEFCIHRRSGKYLRAVEMFLSFKDTMSPRATELPSEVYRNLVAPELLVVDEITVCSNSAWERDLFRTIIDARHAEMKATLLCGNVSADKLDEDDMLGVAISRRIAERGCAIECNWDAWWEKV